MIATSLALEDWRNNKGQRKQSHHAKVGGCPSKKYKSLLQPLLRLASQCPAYFFSA